LGQPTKSVKYAQDGGCGRGGRKLHEGGVRFDARGEARRKETLARFVDDDEARGIAPVRGNGRPGVLGSCNGRPGCMDTDVPMKGISVDRRGPDACAGERDMVRAVAQLRRHNDLDGHGR
jgi:hypothetical protein